MEMRFIFTSLLFVILLAGCSSHTPPDEDGIKHAIEEGRDIKVSNVDLQNCKRHNGVDNGDDPHFDWYGCNFTATLTKPSGQSATITTYGAFVYSNGWHDTR